jgi:GTP-binding protein HflX
LPEGQQPRQESDLFELDGMMLPRVFVSARSGQGLGELRRQLAELAGPAPGAAAIAPESPEIQDHPA